MGDADGGAAHIMFGFCLSVFFVIRTVVEMVIKYSANGDCLFDNGWVKVVVAVDDYRIRSSCNGVECVGLMAKKVVAYPLFLFENCLYSLIKIIEAIEYLSRD